MHLPISLEHQRLEKITGLDLKLNNGALYLICLYLISTLSTHA
jgi:hypothetical protein